MKKGIIFCVTLLLCTAVFLSSASAGTANYKLDDLKMTVDIPDNCMVLTRNIADDDPVLSQFNMTREEIQKEFTDRNIFLNAIPADSDTLYEIVITKTENDDARKLFDIKAFKEYYRENGANKSGTPDEYMKTLAKDIISELNKSYPQIKWIFDAVVDHPQAVFFRITSEREEQGELISGIQYCTIINGHAINMGLNSYGSAITEEQMELLSQVVQSANFYDIQKVPEGNFKKLLPSRGIDWGEVARDGLIGALTAGIITFAVRRMSKRKKIN